MYLLRIARLDALFLAVCKVESAIAGTLDCFLRPIYIDPIRQYHSQSLLSMEVPDRLLPMIEIAFDTFALRASLQANDGQA